MERGEQHLNDSPIISTDIIVVKWHDNGGIRVYDANFWMLMLSIVVLSAWIVFVVFFLR